MKRIPEKLLSLVLGLLILTLNMAQTATGAPLSVLLNVQEAEVAWADPALFEQLEARLIRDLDMQVLRAVGGEAKPAFPSDRRDTDSLVNWAAEVGGRYLMVVTIHSERFERKKTFSIPLLFSKYETVGVVEGEMAFYDIARGRRIISEPINMELEAARVFQVMEEDSRDPSIHLTASEKIAFFNKLENRLAERLCKYVKKVLRKS